MISYHEQGNAAHVARKTEEKEWEEGNRNESPRWWPIKRCWELTWEQRNSSQPENWNALQWDTVNLSTYLLSSFCLVEESGFRNNWKQCERGGRGSAIRKSVVFLYGGRQFCTLIKPWMVMRAAQSSKRALVFFYEERIIWLLLTVPSTSSIVSAGEWLWRLEKDNA